MRKITLEDCGQDFLWFKVDGANVIQETGPFQGWLWNGKKIDGRTIRKGTRPVLVSKNGRQARLNYPISMVEAL